MSQETSFVGEPSSSTTSPAQHAFSTANIASSAGDAPSSSSSSSYSSSRSSLAVSITEEIRLKKHLGLMNGVAIIVGIIVGSGIFISPKGVILEAGSVGSSLAIWGLCGVVCLFGAMCYAELGTAIVKLLTLLLLMIVSGREHYGGHPPKKATGPDEWGGHYYKNHCGVRHLHLSQRRDTSDTGGWLCGLFSCILDLCGFACLFGDMCYAEIGTAIVKSGADYAYISEAYGSFPSFLYLWVAVIIVLPTGNAITALTFANYILQPIFPECDSPPYMVNLFAALCICKYV